ncbi:MAG: inverse autotransporter beta domain-containing protein [Pelagibacteraceae bacterium]|jgi:hypothetical protein|nr:inverse autotransporter beta domain-containing protein [Pelagibacteraceae bacterium]MBO6493477.1 inverse autotransporter beta domain-containing protein [Pelagibacteraceae bacterium]|tara:strand:- start:200 stop:1069 length:870 start_codon:yes stop_codon:yes gene_type:complete
MKLLIKIVLIYFLTLFASNSGEILQNVSGKISEFASSVIPGEGLTEVNIEIKEGQEPDFTILGVRDIYNNENSNFFTQFSLHNNDVGGEERYIGNLGFGYRFLTNDESIMVGVNSFYDKDLKEGHARGSIGLEARASVVEFNVNQYYSLTNMKTISGTDEQSIGSIDYKLSSQIPYMPWGEFSWTGYKHEADKATVDTEGDIFSLEMALTPSLQLDLSRDKSNHADGDVSAINLFFIYPPRDNKSTLADGFINDEIWRKESMKNKLSDKVERNNNLVIEIQGSVIITSK